MPKFKIEMELTSITERILLTDFDSSEGKNQGIAFNESLTEEENSLYRLTFSIAEDFGRTETINIGKLISIGRPIWLHTTYPNRSIRMVISSFTPVIGPENTIYEIEAQDYASYAFSRNNVGLTLDTMIDEDFIDWAKTNSVTLSPKIEDIANHILQRGWLQKYDGITGWKVEVDEWQPDVEPEIPAKSEIQLNLEVSGSNTYGALVTLAETSNTFLDFDYDYPNGANPKVYFWNKENLELDKNYTLQRGMNLENFTLRYDGENLYSIFYIDGAEDELGLRTLLTDVTEYKDNFLFNFNYFKDRDLIPDNTTIEDDIVNNLGPINKKLQQAIRDKFNTIGRIRELETEVQILAERVGTSTPEDYAENFQALAAFFERKSQEFETKIEERTFTTPWFTMLWSSLTDISSFSFDNPVTIKYRNEILTDPNGSFMTSEGIELYIAFQPGVDFVANVQNGITYYYKVENPDFVLEELTIISSRVQYSETVEFTSKKLNSNYLYFGTLDKLDGEDAIDEAEDRWWNRIQDIRNLWLEDLQYIDCLNSNTTTGVCEPFWIPDDALARSDLKEGIEKRIDDYIIGIGNYDLDANEINENSPGKFTLIYSLFEKFREDYALLGKETIMERYRSATNSKKDFWYNLKQNRQHVFVEGYYENDFESVPSILKQQAEAVYLNFQKPSEEFGMSYVDISDLLGVNLNLVRPGDFVTLKEDKLDIVSTKESKLKVAQVARVLRDKSNITLTIYRYNMVNTILEKIMASNQ